MNTDCIQFELGIQGGRRQHVEVARDDRDSSSDGGLLLLAEIERRRGFLDSLRVQKAATVRLMNSLPLSV